MDNNKPVWIPSPEGIYSKLSIDEPSCVWLGGQNVTEIVLSVSRWCEGRYSIRAVLTNASGKTAALSFDGIAVDVHQLCTSLLSQLSAIGRQLPSGIVVERLMDFLQDQLTENPLEAYRFSSGIGGTPWICRKELAKLSRQSKGCQLKLSGEVLLHPAIFLQRVFNNHRLPTGWAQRLGLVKPERFLEPITLLLDISKPNKGIHYPQFNHQGVIVTGYRGGLESWAVQQAIEQSLPYLQIRNYADIERLINLLPGARLITPYQRSKEAYGKVRANLIEMANVSQSRKRTA